MTAVVRWTMSQRCPNHVWMAAACQALAGAFEQFSAFTADHSHEAARRVSARPARILAQCSRTRKRLRPLAGGAQLPRGLRYPRMARTPA